MDLFDTLLAEAKEVVKHAYVPYSNFAVGAAIATKQGKIYSGCNIENASYGLALCAERNAITTAAAEGIRPGDITRLVLFIDKDPLFSPCGACRQVMSEFMEKGTQVTAVNRNGDRKDWTVGELLPDGFEL